MREFENVIERAVILSDDDVIHGYNLPPSPQTPVLTVTVRKSGLEARLDAVEYEMLVESLKTHYVNIMEPVRELGLSRRIMGPRMKKYNLNYQNYRSHAAAVIAT